LIDRFHEKLEDENEHEGDECEQEWPDMRTEDVKVQLHEDNIA
jgi:hypothetical protein